MTRTGFLGIPAGDITWETLLSGSVGVFGGVFAVMLAFWLQTDHNRDQALRDAVERYRDAVLAQRAALVEEENDAPARDMALMYDLLRAELLVRARAGRRDTALVHAVLTLHDSDVIHGDEPDTTIAVRFLTKWLETPRSRTRRRVTLSSARRDVEARQEAEAEHELRSANDDAVAPQHPRPASRTESATPPAAEPAAPPSVPERSESDQ